LRIDAFEHLDEEKRKSEIKNSRNEKRGKERRDKEKEKREKGTIGTQLNREKGKWKIRRI
jgi:hypothetical protein